MLKKLKLLFFPVAIIFICSAFTGAYFSDSVSVSGNNVSAGTWATPTPTPSPSPTPADVVINEVMVNPSNAGEGGPMPDGEWIELYNKGGSPIDVAGWYIYDNTSSSYFTVTAAKTNTGSTVMSSSGSGRFLAVYRNIGAIFSNSDDNVRVYDGPILTGNPIDSFDYSSSTDGVSWARMPDSTGGFTDGHTPTPGGPNE